MRSAAGVCCESLDVALSDSIGQVRERISDSLSVRSEDIQLSYNGVHECRLSAGSVCYTTVISVCCLSPTVRVVSSCGACD